MFKLPWRITHLFLSGDEVPVIHKPSVEHVRYGDLYFSTVRLFYLESDTNEQKQFIIYM